MEQQEQKQIRLLDVINDVNAFKCQQAWGWKNDRIHRRIEEFSQESWIQIIARIKELYEGSFKYTTEQIFAYLVDEPVSLSEEDYFILECLFLNEYDFYYPSLTKLQKEFLKEMEKDKEKAADLISLFIKNGHHSWFHFFCSLFFSLSMVYFAMRWKGPALGPGETFPPAWIDEELNRPYKLMGKFALSASDIERIKLTNNGYYGDDLTNRLNIVSKPIGS